MKVIYGLGKKIKEFERPCIALGVFDGLHLGHQYILKSMARFAKAHNKKAVCITFFPHPSKVLSSKNIFVHLISLKHRLKLISALDIDACIVISFTRHFSRISAESFVDMLDKKLNPSVIFVGSNFTFGRGGRGNVGLLKNLAKEYAFKIKEIAPRKLDGKIISSTLIRSLITKGELKSARKYLGRNVTILGKVIKGRRLGRRLGYHTANIGTEHEVIPPCGIYAAKVRISPALSALQSRFAIRKGGVKNKWFGAVVYIGTSPTMHFCLKFPRLEVYILDFYKNIYGKEIEVEFIQKIRNEKKFTHLTTLVSQIKEDIIRARSILSHSSN